MARHLAGHLGRAEGAPAYLPRPLAQFLQPRDGRGAILFHRRQAGDHGDRVGVEGAAMGQGRLALAGIEDFHHFRPSGDRAHRKTPADDFSQRGQVGLHAPFHLHPAGTVAEGDHLVEDQHDSVPAGEFAQHVQEFGAGGNQPGPVGHDVHDHRGQGLRLGFQDAVCQIGLVERDHHHVVEHALRRAGGVGHTGGRVVSPALGR